jgi:hypothetical protein
VWRQDFFEKFLVATKIKKTEYPQVVILWVAKDIG